MPIVMQGEVMGYATNRIWCAVKKEVFDRGRMRPEDIDRAWMLDWGTSIGSCGLMDKVGLEAVRDIELIYYRASGDSSYQLPPMLQRIIATRVIGSNRRYVKAVLPGCPITQSFEAPVLRGSLTMDTILLAKE